MNILVVEDQDSIRNMIEALVRACGYGVSTANNGAQALELALAQTHDLILLDLMMPGQYDGIEICQRLRSSPATSSTPIVIISAVTDEQTKQRALEAGACAYYTKPFSPMALLRELERHRQNFEGQDPARPRPVG